MTTPIHPLAQRIMRAQEILAAHARLTGPSKADTIKSLNELLRSPEANLALLEADAHAGKKVAEASATFIRVLERAQSRLAELRLSHPGSMGMSIDRDLAEIGAAVKLAKEGQK